MANPSRAFELIRLWPGLTADPASGLPGEIYFNSTTQSMRFYNGTSWTDFGGVWANQQLSNLIGPTSITASLLPDTNLGRDLGSTLLNWGNAYVASLNMVASISDVVGGGINISSQANTGAFASGALNILTGSVVDGTSGTIALATGAATGTGSRGVITMSAASVNLQLQTPLHFGAFTSSNYVAFQGANTIPSSVTWTLPSADGSPNQFLQTNGSGILNWGTVNTAAFVLKAGDTMTGNLNLPSINLNAGQFQWLNNAQIQLEGVIVVKDIQSTAFPGYLSFTHTGGVAGGAYVGIDDNGLANLSPGNLILMANSGNSVAMISNAAVKFLVSPSVTTMFQDIVPNAAAARSLGSNSLWFSAVQTEQIVRQAQVLIGAGGTSLPSGASSAYGLNDLNIGALGTMAVWSQSNNAANATATGSLRFETGNKTAGTGNSGDIHLQVGTSSGGTRGFIYHTDGSESGGAGYVWTLQDTTGKGRWAPGSTAAASGANGSVQLSNGSGVFISDPTKFFWDSANHRLGVGTNNPRWALEVNDAAAHLTAIFLSGQTSGDAGLAVEANTVTNLQGTNGSLNAATNLVIQRDGGQLGIGINPSFFVHIQNNTTGAGTPQLYVNSTSVSGEIDNIILNSGANTGMRITNTGLGLSSGLYIGNNGGATADFQMFNTAAGGKLTLAVVSNNHLLNLTSAGKIQFQDGTQGTAGYVWTSIDANGTGSWAVAGSPTSTANTVAFFNNSGTLTSNTSFTFNAAGSITVGLGSQSVSSANGAMVRGYAANSTMVASGDGSMVSGYLFNGGSISNAMAATGTGAHVLGTADDGQMYATNIGSIAMGAAFAGSSGTPIIQSTGFGSIAAGLAISNGVMTSSGSGSFACGMSNGNNASGTLISSSGNGSFAGGYANSTANIQTSGDGAFSYGQDLNTSGSFAQAFGIGHVTNTYLTMAIGRYSVATTSNPTTFTATDPIFVIGNGTGTGSRANAFRIDKDGRQTTTAAHIDKMRVVVGNDSASARTDWKLLCSQAGGGSFTLTLPAGVQGLNFILSQSAMNTATFTITPTGGDTLDANIQTIFNNNQPVSVTYDAGTTIWYAI